jgi:hypothetical protein
LHGPVAAGGCGDDIADPDVRQVVAELVRRAVALVAAHHADIADDTPRLRHALECWTGLNRSATRRWLQSDATREQTHELLTSTLEHVLCPSERRADTAGIPAGGLNRCHQHASNITRD